MAATVAAHISEPTHNIAKQKKIETHILSSYLLPTLLKLALSLFKEDFAAEHNFFV